MSKNPSLAQISVDAQNDAISLLLDAGFIDLFDGTQPASSDTPITTQNLLSSHSFSSPAFNPSVGGIATANSVGSSVILLNGIVTWFRAYKSDHLTAVQDGSVDTIDADLIVSTTVFVAGQAANITAMTNAVSV